MKAAVGLALFFLFDYSLCTSQSGVLKGKLLLENVEDEKFLPDKILIVITQGDRRDTAVVDHNLSFAFENVKSDSFRFKIIPPSKLPYTLIRFSSEGATKILEADYAPICKYSDSKTKTNCPTCHRKNKVIPIFYGLIVDLGPRKDHRKYKRGGCIVRDCQPNWHCERDGTKF